MNTGAAYWLLIHLNDAIGFFDEQPEITQKFAPDAGTRCIGEPRKGSFKIALHNMKFTRGKVRLGRHESRKPYTTGRWVSIQSILYGFTRQQSDWNCRVER